MNCKICHQCGLCEGKYKTYQKQKFSLTSKLDFFPSFEKIKNEQDDSFSDNQFGIAFDIGTSSIVAACFALKERKQIAFISQENPLIEFGTDVISRVHFSMKDNGLEILHKKLLLSLEEMIRTLLVNIQGEYLTQRKGRIVLEKIVVCANSVMESIFAGVDLSSFAQSPFDYKDSFGRSIKAKELFGTKSYVPSECEVFLVPLIKSFVGSDFLCTLLACGILEKSESIRYFVDLGTNCEMAVCLPNSKIYCTSTSAGPAFEGFGIECGMSCRDGAIVSVNETKQGLLLNVINNLEAKGIAGSALISIISYLYRNKLIDCFGAFYNSDKFCLTENVYLSQKDIRNFQLAKSAVYTALSFLNNKEDKINESFNRKMYLAGELASNIQLEDAFLLKFIPELKNLEYKTINNGALIGASMILLSDTYKNKVFNILNNIDFIDLANEESFQNNFLENINF